MRRATTEFDDGLYEPLDWEYVVLEGRDDGAALTVRGTARAADVHLLQRADRLELVGRRAEELRSFTVRATLPSGDVVISGARRTVLGADLHADDLPLVIADDPTHPDLPATFLHQRGERWVVMGDLGGTLVA